MKIEEYTEILSAIENTLINRSEESDILVDKVVDLEQERDALSARVSELLSRIEQLEDEVERRDRAVMAMAEKYQLVPKDTFGEEVIQEALADEKKDS